MLAGLLSFRESLVVLSFVVAAAYGSTTAAPSPDGQPTGDSDSCGGPIAGAAIGTFCATLILIGLIYLVYRRHGRPKRGGKSKSCTTLTSVGVNDDRGRYAYDNPYFDDTEAAHTNDGNPQRINGDPILRGDSAATNTATTVVDGGKNANAALNNSDNKLSPGAKAAKKMKTSKNNLLNVLTTAKLGRHHKALDDSCIHLEPEKLSVPLRGIDFTGLGFNVCGNMRDGIFIKDVLHRGPAMESGKIKAGDRILSLTVSFANMVYEDALTILSYASPYDVQLEVQKMSEMSGGGVVANHGTMGHQKKGSNTSNVSTGNAVGRERLYHPLYRSQSFGDLSKIGKEDVTTKRSSSIGGAAVGVKVPKKEPFMKTVQSLNEEGALDFEFVNSKTATALNLSSADPSLSSIEALQAEDANKPKTSRFRVQKVIENEGGENQQQVKIGNEDRVERVEAVNKALYDGDNVSSSSSRSSGTEFETVDLNDETYSTNAQIPVPAKRTSTGGGGKRKAPLPPPSFGDSKRSDDEYEDDYEDINIGDSPHTLKVSPDIHAVPDWVSHKPSPHLMMEETADSVAIQTHFSSDNESLSSDDEKSVSKPKSKFLDIGGNATAERRASSLGDLTSVEESNKKNFPLERSVSMDFNHAELVHGKLAAQHIDQLGGPKLNENGTALGTVIGGGSDDDLVRVNPLKNYFGATENLYLGADNSLNGHSNFLKSWDQVERLADVDDEVDDEVNERDLDMKKWNRIDLSIPPPIPKSPVPPLDYGSKEDERDLWEVDLSESSSSLSDEEPRIKTAPPPPVIKRMIPVESSVELNYDTSSSSSDEEEPESQENHRSINVVDFPLVGHGQPTSFIHHNSNTGSSTVTIGAPHSHHKSPGNSEIVDPEMVKIFNNITVSNTSRDLFTLDVGNRKVQNGSDNGVRNGSGSPLEDGKEQYESTLSFDLESPDGGGGEKVGVISFESTPPSANANNNTKSSASNLNSDLDLGVSRTLIIANSTNNNDIQLAMDPIPNLQPPQ